MDNFFKYIFDRPVKVILWGVIGYYGYQFYQNKEVETEQIINKAREIVIWIGTHLQNLGRG